eukprot:7101846-Alexandrium_andersonii.AAC.1
MAFIAGGWPSSVTDRCTLSVSHAGSCATCLGRHGNRLAAAPRAARLPSTSSAAVHRFRTIATMVSRRVVRRAESPPPPA